MSKIGFTPGNVGKKFNIVSTHYTAYNLINDWDGMLAYNSLIICSPLKNGENNEICDSGSYSLAATDNTGHVVRLTYNLIPGNGLKVKAQETYSWDDLSLEIDKDSIMLNDYEELHVVKPNIIDNKTLMVSGNQENMGAGRYRTRIGVMTSNLDKSTSVSYGISKGDESTISANNGILSVNTQNLQYVDDMSNTSGIVRFNPDVTDGYDWRTVEATNGVLNVVTYNLDRATAEQVGVVKPDSITTATSPSGEISVLTSGLDKANSSSYGIVRPDNITVEIDGYSGILTANSRNMLPASTSEYGVVKLDENSLSVNNSGYTQVNRYPEIVTILNRYIDDYNYIISRLIDHENRITALENIAAAEYIYSFHNYGTSTTILTEPYYDELTNTVVSEPELKTVVFSINTNCPFNVSVDFTDNSNVTPQITLQTVRLGNGPSVDASALQNYSFSSTDMNESTLSLTFNCRNYTSNTPESFTMTTINIKVSSINNSTVCANGSHIFKRWNTTKYMVALPSPISYITTSYAEIHHTYIGPYLQYYVNETLQYNIETYVSSFSDKKASDDGIADTRANCINVAKENIIKTNTGQPYRYNADSSIVSYFTSYDGNLGAYVHVSAHQNARSSYGFLFSTLYVDKMTTNNIEYTVAIRDGEEVSAYTYAISHPETDYTVIYGSSPITLSQQYKYPIISATYVLSYRDKSVSGLEHINDNWLSHDLTIDSRQWFSYNVSTLSSNTGKYNVLNIGSSIPLTSYDRKATLTISTVATDHREEATGIDDMISELGFTNTLKFTLVEDLVISDPTVSVQCECIDNEATPLRITITRSADSIVSSENNKWSVTLQYYFVTSSGNYADRSTAAGSTGKTDTSEITALSLTIIMNDNEFSHVEEVSLNAADNTNNENKYYLPESIRNYYNDTAQNNNISTIKVTNIEVAGLLNAENAKIIPEKVDETYYPCVYGSWPIHLGEEPQLMTFGNAEIRSISITPWGDNKISVSFTIRPENATILNPGTQIRSSSVTPNVVFYDGNTPIHYSEYYNRCYFEGTGNEGTNSNVAAIWSSTGCTVTLTMDQGPTNTNSTQVNLFDYSTQSTNMVSVNSNSPLVNNSGKGEPAEQGRGSQGVTDKNGNTTQQNAASGIQRPLLYNITGIRFKFGLTIAEDHDLNFLTCVGDLTSKVSIDAIYNNGGNVSVSMPNALYNSNPGVSVSQTEQNEGNESSIASLAESLEEAQRQIETLTNLVTNNI